MKLSIKRIAASFLRAVGGALGGISLATDVSGKTTILAALLAGAIAAVIRATQVFADSLDSTA